MKTAYKLSTADTFTPVSTWMAMPIRQINRWIDVVVEVQAQQKKD